jgi:hypothetical protein
VAAELHHGTQRPSNDCGRIKRAKTPQHFGYFGGCFKSEYYADWSPDLGVFGVQVA